MSPRPFLLRLLLPFMLLAILIAAIAGGLIYWVGQGTIHWDQIQTLDLVTSTVRSSLNPDGRSLNPTSATQLQNISKVWDARITLIDGGGRVLFDTRADPAKMQNHNDRPEVIDARRQHMGSSSRFSATLDQHAVYLAELLDESNPDGLVVRVSYPKRHWASLELPIWLATAGGLLAPALMVALIALILQRQWINPARNLAAAAERMAAGQWNARVDPRGAEDVRFLAGRMNLVASHAQNMMQMKTDFVANASHELRTPIAAIKIALETLRDVYGDDAEQSERCINIINGHVKRLEEMLRDLLDLSRLESPDVQPKLAEVKPLDLFAVVRSTHGPTAREKGIDLRFDDEPTGPDHFRSDERLLHLVLKNLVENSLKFTPPGGSITTSLRPENGDIQLVVTDTGIGIPSEHRDRVFERFYQVDAARSGTAGRGTGLGLAIVKHAVAALGGTVRLESAVGKGTTVICIFPQNVVGERS